MSRRLIIIAIALIVLIGGSVLVVWLVNRSPSLQNAVYQATNTKPAYIIANTVVANTNVAVISPDKPAIKFVARNFAERFGSWSNQNDASNLVAAKAYATTSYAAYLDKQIQKTKATPVAAEYSGTITKALVFTFLKQTAALASIQVTTQQEVTTGSTTITQTKNLLIELVKVGEDWKVNAAVWN
jgi:hypothetical protein